jgi:hypothetical protein
VVVVGLVPPGRGLLLSVGFPSSPFLPDPLGMFLGVLKLDIPFGHLVEDAEHLLDLIRH